MSVAPVLVTAVALDDRVDLDAVAPRLPWPARRHLHALVLRPPGGGAVHLFRFGAVVVEGDGAEQGVDALLDAVEGATGRRCLAETREATTIRVDPGVEEDGGRVGWDQVAVRARSPERMAAIALLLGQSAALERYEHAADRILEEALAVADSLARRGRPPQRTRELMRRLGRIISDRLALARWFFLVDRPEETWEHPEVAALYDALFRNLELRERHEAMLHKLRAAESGLETTVDLWHARWSHRLEWAIVILIVVDIVLVLVEWIAP